MGKSPKYFIASYIFSGSLEKINVTNSDKLKKSSKRKSADAETGEHCRKKSKTAPSPHEDPSHKLTDADAVLANICNTNSIGESKTVDFSSDVHRQITNSVTKRLISDSTQHMIVTVMESLKS